MIRAGSFLTLALAWVGCFDIDRVPGPVLSYENDPEACNDGRDNDHDGMTDCADSSCIGAGLCGVIIVEGLRPEPENTFDRCVDRIDNDQDGNWDCGDRNCQAIMELCCTTEFSDATCSDGFDNDENGFRDCGDFGCRLGRYVGACDAEEGACDPADAECRTTLCSDGRDNDGDGDPDCEDGDCLGVTAAGCPGPEPEDDEVTCFDGLDNDGNGFRDCGDFSCSRMGPPDVVAECGRRAENTLAKCSDGEDNDGNGFTDCDDFSCSRSTDPDIMALCAGEPDPGEVEEEASFEACKNGLDDDEDGFADCADFSCQGLSQDNYPVPTLDGGEARALASPCEEVVTVRPAGAMDPDEIEQAQERCSNGLDEDIDGFFDCEDWDCQWNPLLKPGFEQYVAAGRTPEEARRSEDGFCQGWFWNGSSWMITDVSRMAPKNRPLLCR